MREEKYIEKKREKGEEIGERRMGLSPIGEALTNTSSDLINFEEIIINFLICPWIRPLFTIMPLNSS